MYIFDLELYKPVISLSQIQPLPATQYCSGHQELSVLINLDQTAIYVFLLNVLSTLSIYLPIYLSTCPEIYEQTFPGIALVSEED